MKLTTQICNLAICKEAHNSSPVVVHIADEQWIEGVQIPAEHSKLVSDCSFLTVHLCLALHTQLLLLSYYLP